MEEEGDVDIGAMSWRPPASADAAAKSGAEVDDPVEKDRLVKCVDQALAPGTGTVRVEGC